ncbi:MAG: histidine--tRNA ligase [Bacteroidales bacterium]|nr:histidine--tRNA ligase [Bacteroidales bacterium]MDY0314017.1 histidine--tRNA ligase [Bacteroidales bacterium]
MAQQISIPKGTRDFGTLEMMRRNYIFETIKTIFKKYGYSPIETPAMENLSTLLGKYGDEGDKLLFKILNSGNYSKNVSEEDLGEENINKLSAKITEKGLRYDLTVPFARFVVQHRHEIQFPFKRYQIQAVWRADRPQKGRYREFYQCDVDVIGSNSMLNEFELMQIVDEVFTKLDISVVLKINNRKILEGIAEIVGAADKFLEITIAIDKIDKIGLENVCKELEANNLSKDAINKLIPILENKRNSFETIEFLEKLLKDSEIGLKGIEEIKSIFNYLEISPLNTDVELDLSLARGLNYYTGAIFEVKAKDIEIGSISGGGRYDNLTEIFGLKDVSGVGISFGADRIYDVLASLEKFPETINSPVEVLFVNFGKEEEKLAIKLAQNLRQNGISCEIYPDKAKLDKQFKYANNKNINFVIIIGENELKNGIVSIKNMISGEQENVDIEEIESKVCKVESL